MKIDSLETQKYMYDLLGWKCEKIKEDSESKEYGACSFEMNGKKIIFRIGKITPTKVGQFVTFWKRTGKSPIMPYDMSDQFDFLVINVHDKDRSGQFVFPKQVLYEKGVISKNGLGGKRAMRIYPAWDVTDNAQAKRTQAWQIKYFFEIDQNTVLDNKIIQNLYV